MHFESFVVVLGSGVVAIIVVRWVAWHALLAVTDTAAWAPARARMQKLQTALRVRHPRLYVALAARLTTRRFSGLPLTLFVLAAIYIAALLGGLTEDVIEAGAVLRFDRAVNASFTALRVPPLIGIFRWITALGAGPDLTAVSATATAFLWADRRRDFILPLWVTFVGAQATTWSGKYLIDRHRPAFLPGITEPSPSFPSGHATATLALFGFIAYALARDLDGVRPRFEVAFWVGVIVLLIGFSRVFLSVHYSTDVIAGFMVGVFWLLVGLALREGRRPG